MVLGVPIPKHFTVYQRIYSEPISYITLHLNSGIQNYVNSQSKFSGSENLL